MPSNAAGAGPARAAVGSDWFRRTGDLVVGVKRFES
jgi:hypothetical protein